MMNGHENLIPFSARSKEEARKYGAKGGRASGEARRRRKSLKEAMNLLLELPPGNARDFNRLAQAGVDLEDMDNGQLVALALFERAKEGDVAAIRELRDMAGEKAADKVEHDVTVRLGEEVREYAD